MDNVKIYVITHKKFDDKLIKGNKEYDPLLVGKAIGNIGEANYLEDNVADNISEKNKSFCELTGIYWVWKNQKSNIIGFDHYRRYFVNKGSNKLLLSGDIEEILKKYDAILPQKEPDAFLGKTAAQYFGDRHDPLIWTFCRDVIKEKYPDYVKDFDWYSYQYSGYSYNMIITYQNIMNEYNKWLFDILFLLDQKISLKNYTDYNKRMWGFLSERLINVWLHHQQIRIIEYPVMFVGKKKIVKPFIRKLVGRYWKKTHPIYKYDE